MTALEIPSLQKSFSQIEHKLSQEIILRTGQSDLRYGFQEINSSEIFEFDRNIVNGQSVLNLVLFEENETETYKGFSKKNSDGLSYVTVVADNKLVMQKNTTIIIEFQCMNTTCTDKLIDDFTNFSIYGDFNGESNTQISLATGFYDVRVQICKQDEISLDIDLCSKNNYVQFEVGTGAAYTLIVKNNDSDDNLYPNDDLILSVIQDINSNNINMLWIIPQFLLITISEIMVSITCVGLPYTQTPKSIKAISYAVYFISVSIGNLIIIFIAETRLTDNRVNEYLLFVVLLVGAAVCEMLLGYFCYDYVEIGEFDDFDYPERFDAKRVDVDRNVNKSFESIDEL